ncbi:MAG: hypothetical protein GXO69_06785 [Acidobacteria bacterium]|nr:hypothetical protein [Acidobacteriota bacterium]
MRKALIVAIFFLTIASLADVLVTFSDGSVLKCDRVVKEDSQVLVVQKNGRKMSIQRKWVRSVKKVENAPVSGSGNTAVLPKKEKKTETAKEGTLVLTDDNIVRTVPYRPYALVKQKKEKKKRKAPAVSINVVTQKTIRSGDSVTFEGTVKNDMTETVHKLKMIVQALDSKGKVFAETASQISDSIAVGKTAPFSFQFKDPDASISRFSFRFEGVSGGTESK